MNVKIFGSIFVIFLLSLTVFAASGQTSDGNTRVELVYMTEIGDSNLPIDGNYLLALASDDLTGGLVTTPDGNYARIGVFFTDFELINYKIFITLIDPKCYTNNTIDLIRFNVNSQSPQNITDINYVLNGVPGLDLNGFCTGDGANQACARLDPNIKPFVTNTITIFASNGMNITSVTCDFNFNPTSSRGVIIVPKPDWFMFLLLIFVIGGFLLFLFYRRR
jgi:hypothetical protein